MRLPGAALLITIGLFILWLAATGSLDKLGKAWDFIRSKSDLPGPNPRDMTLPGNSGIHDFSTYHVETHLAQPMISTNNPGGL